MASPSQFPDLDGAGTWAVSLDGKAYSARRRWDASADELQAAVQSLGALFGAVAVSREQYYANDPHADTHDFFNDASLFVNENDDGSAYVYMARFPKYVGDVPLWVVPDPFEGGSSGVSALAGASLYHIKASWLVAFSGNNPWTGRVAPWVNELLVEGQWALSRSKRSPDNLDGFGSSTCTLSFTGHTTAVTPYCVHRVFALNELGRGPESMASPPFALPTLQQPGAPVSVALSVLEGGDAIDKYQNVYATAAFVEEVQPVYAALGVDYAGSSATGGYFSLTFDGRPTARIAYDALAAVVGAYLTELSTLVRGEHARELDEDRCARRELRRLRRHVARGRVPVHLGSLGRRADAHRRAAGLVPRDVPRRCHHGGYLVRRHDRWRRRGRRRRGAGGSAWRHGVHPVQRDAFCLRRRRRVTAAARALARSAGFADGSLSGRGRIRARSLRLPRRACGTTLALVVMCVCVCCSCRRSCRVSWRRDHRDACEPRHGRRARGHEHRPTVRGRVRPACARAHRCGSRRGDRGRRCNCVRGDQRVSAPRARAALTTDPRKRGSVACSMKVLYARETGAWCWPAAGSRARVDDAALFRPIGPQGAPSHNHGIRSARVEHV